MSDPKPPSHALTPYLCCKDATTALDFYAKAFGAVETLRMSEPSGRIGHAEIEIQGAALFVSDEYPEMKIVGPSSLGGTPVSLHLYVPNADATVAAAEAAGAKVERAVADQFYGDRSGTIVDPSGHRWMISTRKEEVSPEEMQRRVGKAYEIR